MNARRGWPALLLVIVMVLGMELPAMAATTPAYEGPWRVLAYPRGVVSSGTWGVAGLQHTLYVELDVPSQPDTTVWAMMNTAYEREFDFGDGESAVVSSGYATHVWAEPGIYRVRCKVRMPRGVVVASSLIGIYVPLPRPLSSVDLVAYNDQPEDSYTWRLADLTGDAGARFGALSVFDVSLSQQGVTPGNPAYVTANEALCLNLHIENAGTSGIGSSQEFLLQSTTWRETRLTITLHAPRGGWAILHLPSLQGYYLPSWARQLPPAEGESKTFVSAFWNNPGYVKFVRADGTKTRAYELAPAADKPGLWTALLIDWGGEQIVSIEYYFWGSETPAGVGRPGEWPTAPKS